MAITCRHRDRLVARRFLNFFDGCAGHCQPRAESVPVRVPDVSRYSCLFQTRMEPRTSVVALSLTREDRIARPKIRAAERFNRCDRIRVQVNRPRRAVLCFGQLNCSAVEMNLGPGAGVLLGEAHSGMDAHNEFS